MDALQQELDVLRQRDQTLREDLRHFDEELRLAGLVQRDLLRSRPPQVEGLDILTLCRPAQPVSGDMYRVVRLDESHVAVSLADIAGHGLPAALLTAFVKQGLKGTETAGGQARRLEPDEVLIRLNRDLLDAQLRECQFVTAVHAVYDERAQVIRWARGGAPYPILARRGDAPRQAISDGPILGASPRARFEVVELQLEPGDTLVFHTDGLDALLLDEHSGLGLSELSRSHWFQALGRRPAARVLRDVEERLDRADPAAWKVDDVSLIVLRVHDAITGYRRTASTSSVPCHAGP